MFCFIILLLKSIAFGAEQPKIQETLEYKIRILGFITVGYAEMTVSEPINKNGVDLLVLNARTWTTDFVSTFHPVDDRMISYWDLNNKQTLWSQKQILHGSFKRHYEATFDFDSNKIFWKQKGYSEKTTLGKNKGILKGISTGFMDMLSAVYYSRTNPDTTQPGSVYVMDVFDDLKRTELKMEIIRKEKIEIKINGKVQQIASLVVKPFYKTTGLFQSKGGLTMWISDDENHWPLKITSAVTLGTAEAELYQVK